MTRLLALLLLALASMPTQARTVRMLFVGIDHYEFSSLAQTEISDLKGPVDDVALIKAVIGAYR